MGSINTAETAEHGGRPPGKIEASLNNELSSVEWGEYSLNRLFEKINVISLKYKTSDLPDKPNGEFALPALTAGIQNQGLNNYVPRKNATVLKNTISISANGANTGATFYQKNEFTVLQDAYAIKWIFSQDKLTDNQYLFLTGAVSKAIYGNYEWTNKASWERIKNKKIKLPCLNGKINFPFMEKFIAELEAQRIAELEAYLSVTGLKDTHLSFKEEQALQKLNSLSWDKFNLKELFGESTRGKRLKSADRLPGKLPFVTAGEVNEGISAFIGNEIDVFSNNTTTIDMFGSAKYRNYKYGGDDHSAVVHTEKLSKYTAIFTTAAINKSSHTGKFNYGHNFYAKDANELFILLPAKENEPDYEFMETLISAIQKLVIKDVVLYADSKINATKTIVNQ